MFSSEIEVKTLNHLGIIAGIIDDIGLEEIINEVLGVDDREIVTSGQVVKAIILNGLGFIAQPLYLFVSGDGGIPLFLRVADGNEQDKAVFGQIAQDSILFG